MKIKQRYIWITIAALILIFAGYKIISSRNKPQYTISYKAAQQDIQQTVLATGTVTSNANLSLSFKGTGVVTALKVNVGDQVREGQVLAMLDETSASAALNQAKATVLSAKANYSKVINGATSADITVSQAAVESAQVAYNNAKTTYTNTVAQQQVLVNNAQSAMFNSGLVAQAASTNISTATVTVNGTYTGTQAGSYTITAGAGGSGFNWHVSGLETDDGVTNRGIPQAFGKRGLYLQFSTSGIINGGDSWLVNIPNTQSATYITAYNAYQSALQTQSQADSQAQGAIDTAKAALDSAQAQLALKQTAARPEDVQAAQAQIDNAEAQLQTAQSSYENNEIIAPIDGTITSVDTKIGENVVPQKEALVLLDQTSLHIESFVAESSIALIKTGQSVDMTLDAFGPDKHFSGAVVSIDPASTIISGVIDYRVISSLPQDPTIKPGMTVNLTILIGSRTGVLAVPNRLIKTVNGQQYVTVPDGATTKDIPIQTGFVGDSYTEVTSGLSAGQELAAPVAK